MQAHKPLSKRIFRKKNPVMKFFCPLCGTERSFSIRPRLSRKNYLQVVVTSLFLSVCLYPLIKVAALFAIFVVWGAAEFGVRTLFRKEIPCPHCGFDASWYKRDVKMAQSKVKEFWKEKGYFKDETGDDKVVAS